MFPALSRTSGGLGTMGFGFPAAIGAKVAYPEKEVICIAGDGSFQMNSQEMATVCCLEHYECKGSFDEQFRFRYGSSVAGSFLQ